MKKLVLCLLVSSVCSAKTIRVDGSGGGDYRFIQTAIDTCADYDVIVVAPGVYRGTLNKNLDFGGRKIELRADGEPVTIDCEGDGRGFHFQHGASHSFTVYTAHRGPRLLRFSVETSYH